MSDPHREDKTTIPGAPFEDLNRSPAAQSVARLAAQSHLFMAHYEHRVQLPSPEHWNPDDNPDLQAATVWKDGALQESKYAAFRHDFLPGSFHPMHRGKWTAHELCHGLVGFAWKRKADILFSSLAARLAEVLPVALWYFFDEAGLRRCPKHAGQGPLGREYCGACEKAASLGPDTSESHDHWIEKGLAFVDGELAAVKESFATGELVHHRHGDVDLATDSVAYALAHAPRLGSEEFELFTELFFAKNSALHPTLGSLEARVREVLGGIIHGTDVTPFSDSKWEWIAQDVGWRLLTIAAESDRDLARTLYEWVTALAEDPTESKIAETLGLYDEMSAAIQMPEGVDVFALGYDLPLCHGRSMRQVGEGLLSACPGVSQLLMWREDNLAADFLAVDTPRRLPLGRRFADFLAAAGLDEMAAMANFECALVHPPVPDNRQLGSEVPIDPLEEVTLSPRVDLIASRYNFIRLCDTLRQGRPGQPICDPTQVAIGRTESGETYIAEMPPLVYKVLLALKEGPQPRHRLSLNEADLRALTLHEIILSPP